MWNDGIVVVFVSETLIYDEHWRYAVFYGALHEHRLPKGFVGGYTAGDIAQGTLLKQFMLIAENDTTSNHNTFQVCLNY